MIKASLKIDTAEMQFCDHMTQCDIMCGDL